MSKRTIIEIKEVIPRLEHLRFEDVINWKIEDGQHWAIVGPNGGGKSVFVDILLKKHAFRSGDVICNDENENALPISSIIKSVAFQDIYSIVDTNNSYYQQRFNKGDQQPVPIVKDLVKDTDSDWLNTLVGWFGITDLMDKEINLLSSGELRKFLIVRSLMSRPQVLIMDNPFIGLDAASRIVLNELFTRLARLENLQIVLVLSNPDDIPEMITHILPIENKRLYSTYSRSDFMNDEVFLSSLFKMKEIGSINALKDDSKNDWLDFENAAILNNIHIKYDSRSILHNLDWTIKRGEKWALLGPNGSGKSTLLSLICGDNPQAYANDITLFDRKRGSGESIWDIKKRIGYVSPEMHLYYLKNVRCIDVVSSGFFDTVGLYRKCGKAQEKIAHEWMEIVGIDHIKDISFLNISAGEQRLALLARVFVKNPDLLILDEPLHGLDIANKKRVKKIIEEFCDKDKSLIYVTHYEDEIPNIVDKRLVLTKNQ